MFVMAPWLEAATAGASAALSGFSTHVEPWLREAARLSGVPVLLLSSALLVVTYKIAGRLLRTATQLAIGIAIALGAAYVRGAWLR
jgi:hypothetical protein